MQCSSTKKQLETMRSKILKNWNYLFQMVFSSINQRIIFRPPLLKNSSLSPVRLTNSLLRFSRNTTGNLTKRSKHTSMRDLMRSLLPSVPPSLKDSSLKYRIERVTHFNRRLYEHRRSSRLLWRFGCWSRWSRHSSDLLLFQSQENGKHNCYTGIILEEWVCSRDVHSRVWNYLTAESKGARSKTLIEIKLAGTLWLGFRISTNMHLFSHWILGVRVSRLTMQLSCGKF